MATGANAPGANAVRRRHGARTVLALPREDLLRCLRAIGDPLRLRIIVLLAHPPGPRSGPFGEGEPGMCVSDLRERLGRAHALVSHHVQVLRRAGLIRSTRRGRWSLVQLDTARVAALGQQISTLGGETFPLLGPVEACLPWLAAAAAPGHTLGAPSAPGPRGGSGTTGVARAPSW